MNENLLALIESRMADPEAVLTVSADGARRTYGEVLERAGQYASVLIALGVRPGDRVAVQTEKSAEVIALYLGCLRAGAVYLPLNTGYTETELRYFLADAAPSLVVCSPGKEPIFDRIAAETGVGHVESLADNGSGSLEALASEAGAPPPVALCEADDLAAILYTSGTTGRSKGAMLTHGNLASNASTLAEHWRFGPDDTLLHALPVFHTHGLFVAINVSLLAGARMIFLPGFDLDTVIRLLPETTAMMGVPTFYTRLLSDDRFDRDLVSHMRLFVSGSAPLSAETHRAFEAVTGHAILERYGMTETNMNTSNPYAGDRRAGTVGLPLPGVEIRVADPASGTPLPAGQVGSIEIRGPNVFKGYWQMPEKTASEFRDDGFFISGDLGRFSEDGYLSIVGRDKDLIITGGYNVYPAEIEAAIDELDGVAESAVIGLPHPDFGEGVAAAVISQSGAALSEASLRGHLSKSLAKYKVPKRFFFVDNLPRNAMGKVQKNVLREAYRDTFT